MATTTTPSSEYQGGVIKGNNAADIDDVFHVSPNPDADQFAQYEIDYVQRSKSFFSSQTSFSWINDNIKNPFGLSSVAISFLFVVIGLVEQNSTGGRVTLTWAKLLPKIFAIVIAFYTDAVPVNGLRRKPYLWIGFSGLMAMNLLSCLGLARIPFLGELIVLIQQACLCICLIVGDAMRVERAVYGDDGGFTLIICQGMQSFGYFLRNVVVLFGMPPFLERFILTFLLPLVILTPFIPHLKDIKQEATTPPPPPGITSKIEEENDSNKENLSHRFQEIGWNIFSILQTKPVLHAISFTLILVMTVTCVQVMNIFDGLMDWYFADQWAYGLAGVLAVVFFIKVFPSFSSSNWHLIIGGSTLAIGILCLGGYISNFTLRWGNVAIGGLVSLLQLPLLLLFMGLLIPGLEASTMYLYQLPRTVIGREMGDQLFFATTFFYNWYWLAYVSLLIPIVLIFKFYWIPKTQEDQIAQAKEAQELQEAQLQQQQEEGDVTAVEGDGLYHPKALIGLILSVVMFFAFVQLFWAFGYDDTTNDDDYYYYYYSSQDFWRDWNRFQNLKIGL